jgi:hypothetical protein
VTNSLGFAAGAWTQQQTLVLTAADLTAAGLTCCVMRRYIRLIDTLNPLNSNTTASSFKECVALCTGPSCMWATVSYCVA